MNQIEFGEWAFCPDQQHPKTCQRKPQPQPANNVKNGNLITWYPAECWLLDKATHDSELEPEVPLGLGTFALQTMEMGHPDDF